LFEQVSAEATRPVKRKAFEPETVRIPAGGFWMGREASPGVPPHETPRTRIELPAYAIGKYPVSNREYAEYVRQARITVPVELGWDGRNPAKDQLNLPTTNIICPTKPSGKRLLVATTDASIPGGVPGRETDVTRAIPAQPGWEHSPLRAPPACTIWWAMCCNGPPPCGVKNACSRSIPTPGRQRMGASTWMRTARYGASCAGAPIATRRRIAPAPPAAHIYPPIVACRASGTAFAWCGKYSRRRASPVLAVKAQFTLLSLGQG